MTIDSHDWEGRLRALEDACHPSVSSQLMREILRNLKSGERLSAFVTEAIQQELRKRDPQVSFHEQPSSAPDTMASMTAALPGEIPAISKDMPMKTHSEDLSKIDRQFIESIILRELARGLLKEHMDAIPRVLHALMEYDVLSSHWFPRDDWNELMHDFLDNGLTYTLDSWIELRRQNRLDEEAQAWIQLGREDY